jgi:hypothetical protein
VWGCPGDGARPFIGAKGCRGGSGLEVTASVKGVNDIDGRGS